MKDCKKACYSVHRVTLYKFEVKLGDKGISCVPISSREHPIVRFILASPGMVGYAMLCYVCYAR